MAYIGYYKQCLQGWVKSVARWPCARPRAAFGLAACIAYNERISDTHPFQNVYLHNILQRIAPTIRAKTTH